MFEERGLLVDVGLVGTVVPDCVVASAEEGGITAVNDVSGDVCGAWIVEVAMNDALVGVSELGVLVTSVPVSICVLVGVKEVCSLEVGVACVDCGADEDDEDSATVVSEGFDAVVVPASEGGVMIAGVVL